jgi:hypothetical protein
MSRRDKSKPDLRSAALLLGLDPDKLSEADALRCQLVSTLRGAIDHEQAKAEGGNSADLAKLVTATEALIKFLPASVTAPPPKPRLSQDDALKPLADIVDFIIRSSDAHAPPDGTPYEELRRENGLLRLALHLKTGTRELPPLMRPSPSGDATATPPPSDKPMSDAPEAFDEPQSPAQAAEPAVPPAGGASASASPPPQLRPLDLRAQGAEQKGGSAGFEIRGSSRIIDDGNGFYWGGGSKGRAW